MFKKFKDKFNSVINSRRVTHFRLCLLETQLTYMVHTLHCCNFLALEKYNLSKLCSLKSVKEWATSLSCTAPIKTVDYIITETTIKITAYSQPGNDCSIDISLESHYASITRENMEPFEIIWAKAYSFTNAVCTMTYDYIQHKQI